MKTLIALLLISTSAYSQVQAPIKNATANDLVQKLAQQKINLKPVAWVAGTSFHSPKA